ncbi:SUMF1/EgtB/PvdO family nonheme iron enzyme [Christiangramia sp. LLG6405-1]|uniref:SUMF1/EgtB/PvdO family nonheme iron enzyme n=1 Tax=Christiangramia sp. LLG6405-1 TaxID=3160832 RepID=UPI0038640F3C
MKQYFTILIIFISFSINAQRILEVPPGTIKINDTLFIDKAPIDNLMYSEFTDNVQRLWTYILSDSLKSLELENIDKSLLINSLDKNQNKEIFNKITVAQNVQLPENVSLYNYFNHPQYNYHPVIGISKDLAQIFCQWRTDMVNLRWSTEIKNGDPKYKKIKYRIPTTQEYRLAKDYFSDNNKLLMINKFSPLKIDLKDLRDNESFILFENPEFSSTDQYFRNDSIKIEETNQQHTDNLVFFRCICEVQK